MSTTINGIDKILSHNATDHLQTRDVTIKPAAHIGTREPTRRTKIAGNQAALRVQCEQYCLFDGASSWLRMNATAIVAEIGPPLSTDKPCLASKEFTIDSATFRQD